MDPDVQRNRIAWEAAFEKYVQEYQDLLRQARDESTLFERELELLRPLLRLSPQVVHLLSGHGLDDIGLLAAGAQSVVGVDFSQVAATAAQRRAEELAVDSRYVVAEAPGVPLRDECADLVCMSPSMLNLSGSRRTSPRLHGEDGSRTRSCCSHGAAAEHLTRSAATLSLTLLAEGVAGHGSNRSPRAASLRSPRLNYLAPVWGGGSLAG